MAVNRRYAIRQVITRFLEDKPFRDKVRSADNPVAELERELRQTHGIGFVEDERALLNIIDWNQSRANIRAGFRWASVAGFWV